MKGLGIIHFSNTNDSILEIAYCSENHESPVFNEGSNWFQLVPSISAFGFGFQFIFKIEQQL